MIDVVPGHTREMIEPVRQLFAEFADGGGADLTSTEFLTELVGLPGAYAPPRGRIVVAFEAAHLAGCGALSDAGGGACELRRVYVREEYRDIGVERRLVRALLREARVVGYGRVESDVRHSMRGLEPFLREAGFEDASDEGLVLAL